MCHNKGTKNEKDHICLQIPEEGVSFKCALTGVQRKGALS